MQHTALQTMPMDAKHSVVWCTSMQTARKRKNPMIQQHSSSGGNVQLAMHDRASNYTASYGRCPGQPLPPSLPPSEHCAAPGDDDNITTATKHHNIPQAPD